MLSFEDVRPILPELNAAGFKPKDNRKAKHLRQLHGVDAFEAICVHPAMDEKFRQVRYPQMRRRADARKAPAPA